MTRFSQIKKPIPLKNIAEERSLFRARIFTAAVFVVICFSILLTRYIYLQIQQYDYFSTVSNKNRIKLQATPPTRGHIYDRNGILLADNHPIFTIMVNLDDVVDLNKTLAELTPMFDLTSNDIDRFKARAQISGSHLSPIALKIDLSEFEIARFSERKQDFPGVSIQTKMTRFYPHGDLFSHVIGYVGRINDKEQKILDRRTYAGTDLIGKIGIEKKYEALLHGEPGYQYVEANAHGEVIRQLGKTDATRGDDLYLSIDYGLQKVAHDQLAGRRGAVVAMNSKTGEILAFVSNPSFDPNPFIAGIRSDAYAALRDDPEQPLFNRVLQGLYPPGSTIKTVAGLAGIHYGLIDWSSRIYDNGSFHLPGDTHLFRDDVKGGHGIVNLSKAIIESCDTFYYVLSYRMGIDRMHAWMTAFGFGKKTGIDLPGEKSGLYPSAEWKLRARKSKWLPGETISLGIGQGYLMASPLQILKSTAIIANQGRIVTPHLLLSSKGKTPFTAPKRSEGVVNFNGTRQDWLNTRDAMVNVVQHGTAVGISYGLTGYKIAGKTGTSQVVSIAQGKKYNKAELTKRQHDHALFTAFAPADNPTIAVAVVVENGGFGASAAAPIARKMFDYYLLQKTKNPIKPDLDPFRNQLPSLGQATNPTNPTNPTKTSQPEIKPVISLSTRAE
jgi:penicillin-binding protein 2